jgi:sirohydrochlorin cobaltochelatase
LVGWYDIVEEPMRGLILFAHGARDPAWATPLQATSARAQALQPEWRVALAFLEFLSPSLPECGRSLAEQGCTQIDIVPLFLGAGGHVRRDLPALVAALQAEWPAVQWRLQTAVGEAPRLIEAMAWAACDLAATPATVATPATSPTQPPVAA